MLAADIQNQHSEPIEVRAQAEAQDTTHGAAECRSLRCPLHQWSIDFNGNLVMAAERA